MTGCLGAFGSSFQAHTQAPRDDARDRLALRMAPGIHPCAQPVRAQRKKGWHAYVSEWGECTRTSCPCPTASRVTSHAIVLVSLAVVAAGGKGVFWKKRVIWMAISQPAFAPPLYTFNTHAMKNLALEATGAQVGRHSHASAPLRAASNAD